MLALVRRWSRETYSARGVLCCGNDSANKLSTTPDQAIGSRFAAQQQAAFVAEKSKRAAGRSQQQSYHFNFYSFTPPAGTHKQASAHSYKTTIFTVTVSRTGGKSHLSFNDPETRNEQARRLKNGLVSHHRSTKATTKSKSKSRGTHEKMQFSPDNTSLAGWGGSSQELPSPVLLDSIRQPSKRRKNRRNHHHHPSSSPSLAKACSQNHNQPTAISCSRRIFRLKTPTIDRLMPRIDYRLPGLIPSHLIPSHPIPSHLITSHPISSHPISPHPISSHLIQTHPIPSHLIMGLKSEP